MTNERRDYFPPDDIVKEVKVALDHHRQGDIDWVTFVGSGEPTLHASLGSMIQSIKGMTDIPVAVITNGSLLYLPEVRHDLLMTDAVLPSLDAGNEVLYRKINRPWPELNFQRFVKGLTSFRREFQGNLWVEVMLIKGVNDTESALRELATVLREIEPDEVHLNLPIRPPSELWVLPADEEGIRRAQTIFGDIAKVILPVDGAFDLSGYDNVVDAVIGVITRHPMSESELETTLERWAPGEVKDALARLTESGKVKSVLRHSQRYWTSTEGRFAKKGTNSL